MTCLPGLTSHYGSDVSAQHGSELCAVRLRVVEPRQMAANLMNTIETCISMNTKLTARTSSVGPTDVSKCGSHTYTLRALSGHIYCGVLARHRSSSMWR